MKKMALVLLLVFVAGDTLWATKEEIVSSRPVVFVRAKDSVKLDPHTVTDGESAKVLRQIFETLVAFKPGSLEHVPSLATSWKPSEDELSWTFELRKGVKFHDGTDFNADAVVFSFQRQYDKNHEAHKGDFVYWGFFPDVKSVEKTGDYQVVFHLNKKSAIFLNNLTMFSASIISPASWKTHGTQISDNPVGTGPWKFTSWKRGDKEIRLQKNHEHWAYKDNEEFKKGAGELLFKAALESQVRVSLVGRGDAHLTDNLLPSHVDAAKKKDRLELVTFPSLNVGYLAFNTQRRNMKNVKVRQALSHALDVAALTRQLFRGYAEPAATVIPKNMWGGDPSIKLYEYNIEKAKKLLTEAGYPDGFEVRLTIGNNARPYLPSPKDAALQIKQAFKAINVNVEIEEKLWQDFLTYTEQGRHEMCLLGWSTDNGDPDNFLWTLLSGPSASSTAASNVAFYKNAEVTSLLKQAQSVSGRDKRTAFYQKALNIIHTEVPLIPLAHSEQIVVKDKSIKGFQLHPDGIRAMPFLAFATGAEKVAKSSPEEGGRQAMKYMMFGILVFAFLLFMYTRPRKLA